MKHWVQFFCALLWNWVASGPIFGFAALKPVLVSQGVYAEMCSAEEQNCAAQDLKLNAMFTVAAAFNSVCAVAVGYTLDHKGPRACGYIGSVFIAAGTLLFANAAEMSKVDAYMCGYTLLGIGGTYVFISSFHLMNATPEHAGKVLAAFSGVFDSSAALYMFYRLYYENVNPLSLHTFFSIYLVVPVFIVLCEFFVMPTKSYRREKANIDHLPTEHTHMNDIDRMLPGQTAKQQLKSPWFWLIMLYAVLGMLRLNYFISTVRSQETYLLNSVALGDQLGSFFDVALPIGGIVACPFVGLLLDNFRTLTALEILCAISVTIGTLGLFPSYALNVVGILLFVVYRPFFYTMISNLSMRAFGLETFGTVYGVIITSAGVLNMLQVLVDRTTRSVFHMNPTPLNTVLTLSTAVVAYFLVTFARRSVQSRVLGEHTTLV